VLSESNNALEPAASPARRRPPLERWALAVLLPLAAVFAVQWLALRPGPPGEVQRLAQALGRGDAEPASAAAPVRLPLRRDAQAGGGWWVEIVLPPPDAAALAEPQGLALAFQPALDVYLDGTLLARSDGDANPERVVLGLRRMVLDIHPALRRTGVEQRLQLHLAAPGPAGARLEPPLLGPRAAVLARDQGRQRWQALRSVTATGGLLVGVLLALVAVARRDEPLYALSAAHVALLALLLAPYVLAEQPLPSPRWRALLDVADLLAKALLVVIAARLAGRWTSGLRRALLALLAIGIPLDIAAAVAALPWSDFGQPWPWWALGSRGALLLAAWGLALGAAGAPGPGPRADPRALAPLRWQLHSPEAAWGTALLVGFSAATWAWVSAAALVFEVPVVDANALAHAGWVLWVGALLLAHFGGSARRERSLRQQLEQELGARTAAMQRAFAAQADAERERAAAEQRRRLLQDLHDGLGSQLLNVRLRAAELPRDELARALDACLLEMRLSVDALSESEGDLGVLLGGWRQRVEPMVGAAGLHFDWRVRPTPTLPALQGAGALELERMLQELLANTIRHAQAARVIVATEVGADGAVHLWWVDDGVGLAADARPGQGRAGLQRRAERLRALVAWHSPVPERWRGGSANPAGTAVELVLPGGSQPAARDSPA
jgi:signal transduction histidine kinase